MLYLTVKQVDLPCVFVQNKRLLPKPIMASLKGKQPGLSLAEHYLLPCAPPQPTVRLHSGSSGVHSPSICELHLALLQTKQVWHAIGIGSI